MLSDQQLGQQQQWHQWGHQLLLLPDGPRSLHRIGQFPTVML
jgi:hypothetical protein